MQRETFVGAAFRLRMGNHGVWHKCVAVQPAAGNEAGSSPLTKTWSMGCRPKARECRATQRRANRVSSASRKQVRAGASSAGWGIPLSVLLKGQQASVGAAIAPTPPPPHPDSPSPVTLRSNPPEPGCRLRPSDAQKSSPPKMHACSLSRLLFSSAASKMALQSRQSRAKWGA